MKVLFLILCYLLITNICYSQDFTYKELKDLFFSDTTTQKAILTAKGFKVDPKPSLTAIPLGYWENEMGHLLFFFDTKHDLLISQEGYTLNYFFDDSRMFKTLYNEIIRETFPSEEVGGFYVFCDFKNGIKCCFDALPEIFEGRKQREYSFLMCKFNESYNRSNRLELDTAQIKIDYKGISFQAKAWWQINAHGFPKRNNGFKKPLTVNCYGINDGLKEFYRIEIEPDSLTISQDSIRIRASRLEKKLKKEGVKLIIKAPYQTNYANMKGYAIDYTKILDDKKIYARKLILSKDNHIIWITQMSYNKRIEDTFEAQENSLKLNSALWFNTDSYKFKNFFQTLNEIE